MVQTANSRLEKLGKYISNEVEKQSDSEKQIQQVSLFQFQPSDRRFQFPLESRRDYAAFILGKIKDALIKILRI